MRFHRGMLSDFQAMRLHRRPRRLRGSPASLDLIRETKLSTEDLILPLFIQGDSKESVEVPSMPGVKRLPIDGVLRICERCVEAGIRAVAVFPVVPAAAKSEKGEDALRPDNLLHRSIREIKTRFPSLIVVSDIALDPYTTHGHDGLLGPDGRTVLNDETVGVLARMACLQAEAGVDWVAPSDMMDGRVRAIREALDRTGFSTTTILAYSAKYNSAFYGPFRDAVGSKRPSGAPYLDKSGYQLDPANRREALTEVRLDEIEGADILMVKPAGPYLDVIREVREATHLPLAAYQVSGEYAMIHAAAEKGWLDYERIRDESLLSIRRAGAELILTYFALEWAESKHREKE